MTPTLVSPAHDVQSDSRLAVSIDRSGLSRRTAACDRLDVCASGLAFRLQIAHGVHQEISQRGGPAFATQQVCCFDGPRQDHF